VKQLCHVLAMRHDDLCAHVGARHGDRRHARENTRNTWRTWMHQLQYMIIHARLILCAGPCCQRHVLPPTCIMYVRADLIHQRDTSIHLSIHVRLCIKAAVVIHTNGQLWCFLYRYTHTAASGEGTQTGHVSICIVQYRETSIQPHVLNTEHMKAPSMQADTLPIPDHAPTKYIAIQDVGTPQIQRMYCR